MVGGIYRIQFLYGGSFDFSGLFPNILTGVLFKNIY